MAFVKKQSVSTDILQEKTRENMNKQRSHNSAIISNFSKLLITEEQ